MTDLEPRFCPRCGTALLPGMPFCPRCGLNSAEVGGGSASPANDRPEAAVDALGRRLDAGSPATTRSGAPPTIRGQSIATVSRVALRRLIDRGSGRTTIILGALIVAAGLVVFGLLMRPQAASPAGSGPGPGGSAVGPSALIVGMSIDSPRDRQAVATKEITVIGLAPPGLTITRDVSLGFDQHATADGTGHWAIKVDLNEGENELVFRIGDDRSTEQRLRVTYRPQAP